MKEPLRAKEICKYNTKPSNTKQGKASYRRVTGGSQRQSSQQAQVGATNDCDILHLRLISPPLPHRVPLVRGPSDTFAFIFFVLDLPCLAHGGLHTLI